MFGNREISLQSFKADVYFMCHGLVLTEMMMYILVK